MPFLGRVHNGHPLPISFLPRPLGERVRKLPLRTRHANSRCEAIRTDHPKCSFVRCPGSPRQQRTNTVCRARGNYGSLDGARETINNVAEAVIQTFSDFHRVVWVNGWARLGVIFALFVSLTTAILNTFVLGHLNNRVLPTVTQEVAQILEREVNVGEIQWISPAGLFGITPLASVGPVYVGPGPVEKSSMNVPRVRVGMHVLNSLVQQRIVLWLNCNKPEVDLVQTQNFSWFGHPQDTTPSSSDFLPGLRKKQGKSDSVQPAAHLACEAATRDGPSKQPPLSLPIDRKKASRVLSGALSDSSMQERRMSNYLCSTSQGSRGTPWQKQLSAVQSNADRLRRKLAEIQDEQGVEPLSLQYDGLSEPSGSGQGFTESGDYYYMRNRGRIGVAVSIPNWTGDGARKDNDVMKVVNRNDMDNGDRGRSGLKVEMDEGDRGEGKSEMGRISGISSRGGSWESKRAKRRYLSKRIQETSHGVNIEREIVSRPVEPPVELSRENKLGVNAQQDSCIEAPSVLEQEMLKAVDNSKVDAGGFQAGKEEVVDARVGRSESKDLKSDVDIVQDNRESGYGMRASRSDRGSSKLSADEGVTGQDLRQWLAAGWRQLTRDIKPPEVALGNVAVEKGVLLAHMVGEPIPRQMIDVNGVLGIGAGYHQLDLDIRGKAHTRDPDSVKCTMLAENGPRHLRFVTPGMDIGLDRTFPGDIVPESSTPDDDLLSFPAQLHESQDTTEQTSSSTTTENGSGSGGDNGLSNGQSRYSSMCMSPPFQGLFWDVEGHGREVKSSPKVDDDGNPLVQQGPENRTKAKLRKGKPEGGAVQVTMTCKDMLKPNKIPDLSVVVTGKNLHAPLIDRILEIPMDLHTGRADGGIRIKAFDEATWIFPQIDGRVKCRDVDFHFWDAPDHFTDSKFDLLFENSRLYFHDATGYYGAVPMTVTGDMDIDPEVGHYRLSANVPPVEVNAVRASLGVRPLPHPVAAAVRGVLHCTGPLKEPIFSGSASAVRPSDSMINALEDSHAKSALLQNPEAVGAFDKVEFRSGSAVFRHDMATDVFELHDSMAEPVGGGKLSGRGKMWVAPQAEKDPQAIAMEMEGYGVATKEIVKSYLPEGTELPEVLDCGATNLKATMRGSHVAPTLHVRWEAPTAHASGSAELSRSFWKGSARAPTFDVAGTLHTTFPDFELTKNAYTQSEMTVLTTPSIVGVDADINMKGCDVMPLVSNTSAVDRVASGQAVRLKLNGRTQISARQNPEQQGSSGEPFDPSFSGDLHLQGLRVNQLNVARQLNGTLDFSKSALRIYARGLRADELLDVELKLPEEMWTKGGSLFGEVANKTVKTAAPPVEGAAEAVEEQSEAENKGGYFSLRQGKLLVSTRVNSSVSRVQMRVRGLILDELELASLRGDLQDVSLDLNFDTREGRGEIQMQTPRYSGLRGEYLSGAFRWEHEVVRLEKMVLQQKHSRYEVQGEYSLPPNLVLPRSAVSSFPGLSNESSWTPQDMLAATHQQVGRWRVQVTVPNADVQEILPAGRLLSRATDLTHRNYDEAKAGFLEGLKQAGIVSGEIREHVKGLVKEAETGFSGEASEGAGSGLPGLQTLTGKWNGSVQAYGGGGGASTLNFDIRGNSWRWGEYELDKAVANGSYHSSEGVHLDEISLRTGEAQLLIRGDMMGPKQDATIVLNDFPAALLSPIYKAVPALQNAVPAVTDHTIGLSRWLDSWERTTTSMGLNFRKQDTPMQRLAKGSPVNGLLYVRGNLGGSAISPEGFVNVRLYDGAVGPTRLSGAEAQLTLDSQRQVQFRLDAAPVEKPGFLKVDGTLPFLQENGIKKDIDVHVQVRDGGMLLMSAVVPDFKWESGTTSINFRAHGPIADPRMEGGARIARATMQIPNLKYPLKNVFGSVKIDEGKLTVDHFEAKSGKHGHVKAKGFLPILTGQEEGLFEADVSDLELKVNSMYNGRLDSSLRLSNSLKEPVISGEIELSRGNLQLQYGALGGASPEEEEGGAVGVLQGGTLLGLGKGLNIMLQPPPALLESSVGGVHLQNLRLILGSELRFQVPLMVNLAISGGVEISGGFDPQTIQPSGTIQIDGGMVNLFATQLSMERNDQPGRVIFIPEQGLDPNVDMTFTSAAEGFKAICRGRASTWQENIVLRYRGVEGTDEVQLSQAARMFQKRLADALVADNGQLALVNLAASTMATMSPRLDTQGQIGAARWRLVSAPNIPDLLTNADRLDLHNIVTSLITGTEVEVQFGPTVQAVVAHKMRGADYGTQWNVSLNLTENLRLSATVANSPPTTRTIMLEYSSEGRLRMR